MTNMPDLDRTHRTSPLLAYFRISIKMIMQKTEWVMEFSRKERLTDLLKRESLLKQFAGLYIGFLKY